VGAQTLVNVLRVGERRQPRMHCIAPTAGNRCRSAHLGPGSARDHV